MRRHVYHGSEFILGDCVEGAKKYLADGSVDLILTDPPYGISGDRLHQHYNRDEDFVAAGYVDVPATEYQSFSDKWIQQAARVLKPGGSIFIVSGYTHLFEILSALRKTDLQEVNHIVWKYNFGVFTRNKFVSSHYHILYYTKPGGKRTFNTESRFGLGEKSQQRNGSENYRDREDVWQINREYKPGQVKNKNELPVELLKKMLQYASNRGDLVADFFMGGFSTGRVAIGLNRRFVGFELAQPIFEQRIAEVQALTPGWLEPTLREPIVQVIKNQGKSWDVADLASLRERFRALQKDGLSKQAAVRILGDEFGRGQWSILKALDRRK